jgi:hypothetical protein
MSEGVRGSVYGGDVILRCEHLRASKDDGAEHHPSRLAEGGEHLRMTAVVVALPYLSSAL